MTHFKIDLKWFWIAEYMAFKKHNIGNRLDVVFVMCNLKLNDNQIKKQVDDFNEVLDYLSSND